MFRALLTVAAYVVATFSVQAPSHFWLNAEHYAALGYLRAEPIVALGFLSMLVQGAVMAWLYPKLPGSRGSVGNALHFAWAMGAFLVSYIALAEAGKYAVPAIGPWVAVEAGAAFLQYTVFGLLLALIHRGARKPAD